MERKEDFWKTKCRVLNGHDHTLYPLKSPWVYYEPIEVKGFLISVFTFYSREYALPPSNIICSDTYWAAIPTYYTSK
jgi:hypothetical protein